VGLLHSTREVLEFS